MWISTSAPIAIAPARRQRSTLRLASRIASSEPPRTKVSIVTSAGTTLTASPPLVMIGWMRIVSFSQKVFALGGDRVHRDHRRVQRVDPELRQAAGMRRPCRESGSA